MNEKIEQYQLKLFNKLFSTLPAVKRMNENKSILNLDEPITHLYFFHSKKFWFAKGETGEKYYYLFGKNPLEPDIGESDARIIIDFDKNNQFNDNNLGLFTIKDSEIHILINDNVLNSRYPYFNTGNFQLSQYKSIDGKLNLNVIDLGGLNSSFIENIERFIELSPKINMKSLENIANEKITSIENPEINNKQTSFTERKMNLFINALESGKTHEEAYKIAKINVQDVENWYNLGKKGEEEYIPFYNKYKPLNPENQEKQKKMEIFLDSLKQDRNIDNALAKADLTISKVRAWYSLGEKGNEDYKNFYLACKILLPEGIPKKESKKIVNNEELINEFIALIDDGKTNDEAIEQLKIPKFKVKNWVNQGKLGNKKYVKFYKAYMIEIENKKQQQKAKKPVHPKKQNENRKENKKQISEKPRIETTSETNDNICKICGRKLNQKTKKNICKRCLRKQYASKILLKLLNSIEPEKPFKKEDLKVLGLKNIQITDYIWTLQEFNLIEEKNNKFQLKNKNELETFIKESGLEIDEIPQEETTVKLNKTCKTCGETLEISKFFTSKTTEDGFEDNCKDCKRLITTADYLKEINEIVDYGSEFSEDEIKHHFKSPFQLQAKLWALLDNDLVKKNFETNKYVLTDKKTAEQFLDKYFVEKTDEKPEIIQGIHNNSNTEEFSQEHAKKEQQNTIIKAISEGKSRKEAAEIANIPLYKITHWYNEGRQGYGTDNTNFYKQLKNLEEINESKNKTLKNKMNEVLDELKIKKDISKVTKCSENEINEWIEKGELDEEPYDYFFDAYRHIVENNQNEEQTYKEKAINRKLFLENFKNGKTKEESADSADIDLSLIHDWYLKGLDGKEPYNEFYKKYMEIKNNDAPKNILQIKKTDYIGSEITVTQMNLILESLANGMSEKAAVANANISETTYKYWLNRGKQKFGELYTQFYNYVNKLKSHSNNIIKNEENYPEGILTKLPKEIEEELKKFSKGNVSGFAWTNKTGNHWSYDRVIDGKRIKIVDEDLNKLYEKVKNNNLTWGVRDLEKAKKSLNGDLELPNEEIDSGIYAPLPTQYEESFKSSPSNQSGIAWVNRTGNKWNYSKSFNGKQIKISDENIYELYKKVKNENHIWGIRDYSKARKIIKIPEDFKPPEKNEQENITFNKDKIDPDIYAPLPKKYDAQFNPSQANKTGIAWVNKYGLNWTYSRMINGKKVSLRDSDIYRLHKKVKDANLVWGIKDYDKAKKIINIPNNFKISKYSDEEPTIQSTEILAPLPKRYLSSFNPNQPNKTGIAWVNPVGNKWVYQRKVNGISIKFSDSDIRKLHEVVIKNNHVWGIIDYDKAEKIINTNIIPAPKEEIISPITSRNVTVTYIGKSTNNFDIIIKGIIKNEELINILNRLKLFEKNIKKIITTSINSQVDIFIELEINRNSIKTFEEKIDDLNWKINK